MRANNANQWRTHTHYADSLAKVRCFTLNRIERRDIVVTMSRSPAGARLHRNDAHTGRKAKHANKRWSNEHRPQLKRSNVLYNECLRIILVT